MTYYNNTGVTTLFDKVGKVFVDMADDCFFTKLYRIWECSTGN